MNYKKFLINFNKYKKIGRIEYKLHKLFYKKYDRSILMSIPMPFIAFFSIIAPFVFINLLNIEAPIINISLYFPLMILMAIFIMKKEDKHNKKKLNKLNNLNSYLNTFYSNKVLFFIKDKEISKMNDIFNKHITNEEFELTNEFKNIESNVMLNYKNEFISKNKEKWKYKYSGISLSNLEFDAYCYARDKSLGLLDMIIYSIKHIKISDLKSITEEEMNLLLENFNTEDKIIITDSIKDRFIDTKNKEEELSNNLNEINNIKNENVNILKNNKITIS